VVIIMVSAVACPDIQVPGSPMIKIFGRANSINVRKVLWMVDEVGETWTREDWGRGFRATSEPEFQKLNPVGVVPVIDDDGFVLRESNVIVRYLANKHQRSDLYPADIKKRAWCEAWMDWASTEATNAMRPVFHGLHLKNPAFSQKDIEGGIDAWAKQMRVLDDHLAQSGGYALDDRFSIADIPVGLVVNRWFSVDITRPQLSQVASYYDRLTTRPPFGTHGRNGIA
jgi:glutathione S-transferase